MNLPLPEPARALTRFGSITVAGSDARAFLQGQLSFDIDDLSPERIELASINSSQGRVQAIVWIVDRGDSIVLILSSELVDATVARLRKYILRAKVRIEPGTDQWTHLWRSR